MTARYWALIIFLGALWGCSFLFNAILIRELGPLWVSAGRISIGALGCWAYFLAMRKALPRDPKVYAQLLVLGMMNYAIPFALFPYAEQSLASGLVGVLNGLTPMTTVIVSQFWPGGEKGAVNLPIGRIEPAADDHQRAPLGLRRTGARQEREARNQAHGRGVGIATTGVSGQHVLEIEEGSRQLRRLHRGNRLG